MLCLLGLAACQDGIGAPCARHSDCTVGLRCGASGRCEPPPDASDDGGLDATNIPPLDVDAGADASIDAAIDAP